mgnify:CR=1 FL=1
MPDAETVRRRVGERIRVIRHRRELTRAPLGARCRLTGKYLGEIEKGKRDPSVSTLLRIATGLRCTMAELVFGADAPADLRRVETLLAGQPRETQRRLAAAFFAVAEVVSPYEG